MHLATRIAALVAVFVMPSAGQAHDQKPPRTQAALGLAPLDQGVSLWLVRPKTLLGLELEHIESTWDDLIYVRPSRGGMPGYRVGNELNTKTSQIRVALTIKRVVSHRIVAMFGYLRFYAQNRFDDWGHGEAFNEAHNGFAVGVGGLWRPMPKVSVLLRQGFAFDAYDKTGPPVPRVNPDLEVSYVDKEGFALHMEKPLLLVLIYF